jgi:hypothetical protein
VKEKRYALFWPYMLDDENDDNPYDEKCESIASWADTHKEYGDSQGVMPTHLLLQKRI